MSTLTPFCDDTKIPQYIPVPLFILRENFSLTTKLVYGCMLSRAISSRKTKKFRDEHGIFICISIKEIANYIGRKESVVKEALNTLVEVGYIKKKRRGRGFSNKYYIYLPEDSQKFDTIDSWISDYQEP
jgi:hypothetical protein